MRLSIFSISAAAMIIGILAFIPAANITANVPGDSIWLITEGGQGPQGKTDAAIKVIYAARRSPREDVQQAAEDAMFDMVSELRGMQQRYKFGN